MHGNNTVAFVHFCVCMQGCETPSADTVRGKPTEEERRNILTCPVPRIDPLFGVNGPLAAVLEHLEEHP